MKTSRLRADERADEQPAAPILTPVTKEGHRAAPYALAAIRAKLRKAMDEASPSAVLRPIELALCALLIINIAETFPSPVNTLAAAIVSAQACTNEAGR
jgi:hypothetical protein